MNINVRFVFRRDLSSAANDTDIKKIPIEARVQGNIIL